VRAVVRHGILQIGFAGWVLVLCAMAGHAQEFKEQLPEAPVAATSASSETEAGLGTRQHAESGAEQDVDLKWKNLPERILHDQKEIWLFPVALAHGKYWVPTLVVTAGTAGLIAADPHVMPYFRSHAGNLDDVNDVFDGTITSAEIGIVPLAMLAGGAIRHDAYATRTGLLAGEAYANATILDLAMKVVTMRKRPSDVAAGAPFNDTFFNRGKSSVLGSSFPSGHAVQSFSVATVVANRYRNHRWVPWVAYGLATAISLSRVTTLKHFPSDIFVGAVLGYATTQFTVLRH
jgi:membrane-associated phospholipid phosphatase